MSREQFCKSRVNIYQLQNLRLNTELYFNKSVIDKDKRLSKE